MTIMLLHRMFYFKMSLKSSLYLAVIFCFCLSPLVANNPYGFFEISMPEAIFENFENPVFINLPTDQKAVVRIDSTDPSTGLHHTGKPSLLNQFPTHIDYTVPFRRYNSDKIRLSFLIDLCFDDAFLFIYGRNASSSCNSQSFSVQGSYISKSMECFVRRDNIVVLFDLSKPIYKPSETVKFRILMLQESDRLTSGDTNAYSMLDIVYLEDPNKLRIAQWTNWSVHSANLLTYQLKSDAIEGNYKLTTLYYQKNKKSIAEFIVKDYNIPRFIVEVTPPLSLTTEDKFLHFRICSYYTSGKYIKASLGVKICLKSKHSNANNRPCLFVTGQFKGYAKCLVFNESAAILELKNSQLNFWNVNLIFNVTAKEDETGLEITTVRIGPQLERCDMNVRVISKDYFKPDLPYYGLVEAFRLDNRPYKNASILITIKSLSLKRSWGYTAIYQTDEKGSINFHFPPLEGNQDYNLQLRQLVEEGAENDGTSLRQLPAISTKTLTQWISETNQHLQIVPFDKSHFQALGCPNKITLKLQGNMPLHDKPISVKIMSRGHLIMWHEYPPKLQFDRSDLCTNQDNDYLGHYNCSVVTRNQVMIKCLKNWSGHNCLYPVCRETCKMGACISPGKCQCRRGWQGNTCGVCVKHRACKHGDCLYGDDCYCRPGWQGYYCNKRVAIQYPLTYGENRKFEITSRLKYYRKLNTLFKRVKRRNRMIQFRSHTNQETLIPNQKTIFERELDIFVEKNLLRNVRILVYLESLELVADAIIIKEPNLCSSMKLKSSLKNSYFTLDKKNAGPRSTVTLSFDSGSKNKFCSLRISDAALNYMRKEVTSPLTSNFQLETYMNTPNMVVNNLIDIKQTGSQTFNPAQVPTYCFTGKLENFPGDIPMVRNYELFLSKMYSSVSSLKEVGLSILTNALLKSANCSNPTDLSINEVLDYAPYIDNQFSLFLGNITQYRSSNNNNKFRRKRKETESGDSLSDIILRERSEDLWKFELIDPNTKNITLHIPDSITTWEVSLYCATNKGFWYPTPLYLTVTAPLFVKLNKAPRNRVKRYEIFSIPLTIYNYFDSCYQVKLNLILPHETQTQSVSNTKLTTCLCANEQRTHSFQIIPVQLGAFSYIVQTYSLPTKDCFNSKRFVREVAPHFDALNESIIIVPDGLTKSSVSTDLICLQNETIQLNKSIKYPSDVIQESINNYIVYGGDLMGSTLANLDRLVNIPHGCGEQNLARMVPSIYVLDYYASTGIERSEIKEKALKFIQKGYKDQLKYQLPDGSFSAFGATNNDHKGSTWLTAFVYKSFQDAKKYVFINDDVIQNAQEFLRSQQREDGCFEDYGTVFSKTIKGHFDSDDSSNLLLTAYVLISLSVDKPRAVTTNAINCLKYFLELESYSIYKLSNYSLALLSYAFVLYEPYSDQTFTMIKELRARSNKVNYREYWSDVSDTDNSSLSYEEATASEIETTAYAYLALESFDKSSKLMASVRWLTEQRNSLGGFHSTQDTIVALKALANFAKRLNITSSMNIQVNVRSDGFETTDHITDSNKLLTNRKVIPYSNKSSLTTEWILRGSGCLFIQVHSEFNIPYSNQNSQQHFPLSVDISQKNCLQAILTSCFMNREGLQQTGMLLLTVSLPHGWELSDKTVLYRSWPNVKMVESEENLIHFYYDGFKKFDNSLRCLPINITEFQKLGKVNTNISVTLIDYYEPKKKSQLSRRLKTCESKSFETTKVESQKMPLVEKCPICLLDESNSEVLLSDYLQVACPKSRSLIVVNRQDEPIVGYMPKEDHFYEWQVQIKNAINSNCSCWDKMTLVTEDLVIVTKKRWKIIPGEPLVTVDGDFLITKPTLLLNALPRLYSPLCQFVAPLQQLLHRLYPVGSQPTRSPSCPTCMEKYVDVKRFEGSQKLCNSSVFLIRPDVTNKQWVVRLTGDISQKKITKDVLIDYRCSCNLRKITKNFRGEVFAASFGRDLTWYTNSTRTLVLTSDHFISDEFTIRSYMRRCESDP